MRKIRMILIIICLLAVGILLLLKPILTFTADFLIIREKPSKADVIVVLAGEFTGERINYAVDLYKKGYAKKLLLTGWSPSRIADTAFTMKEQALKMGVPEDAFLMETESTSTYENALFSNKIIEDNAFGSVILVTSTYHSRRAKYIFQKILDKKIKIISCPADVSYFKPESWWSNKKGKRTLIDEYEKLIGYYFYY